MNIFFSLLLIGAAIAYPPLTPSQKSAFEQQVKQALDQSKKVESDLWKEMQDSKTVLTAADKIAAERAATMTAVKETLALEFTGANSLRSEAVRNTLLEILNKNDITPDDLIRLQTVVDKEKPLIEAYDKAQQATPTK